MAETYDPDVGVVGGSFGGVAAALAAAGAGASVVLAESTDWIGGQVTAGGVSALDEHEHVETFGGSRRYVRFREAVRERYRERGADPADDRPLNPGNCWVSRLCFEPRVGLDVLEEMLAPHVEAGRVTVLREHELAGATVDGDSVTEVALDGPGGRVALRPEYVLDATEFGDLLALAGADYATGAESKADTGEPHAVAGDPRPGEMQALTFPVAVEYRPGEDHTVEPPEGYEAMRESQPYTFEYEDRAGDVDQYRMFEAGPCGEDPFWTYRRILDADVVPDAEHDVALINWRSNDYYGADAAEADAQERERVLAEARRLARGFLHWLQTEAPRDDGGTGYPGLCPRPDVMGTDDGLSKKPYVRESRRLRAERRVLEGDVVAGANEGARARNFTDSVGVAWYGLDLHQCVGAPDRALHEPTLPFQLPLGAFLAPSRPDLLPAGKNLGTTHVTNGGYRVHPGEWAAGEAAGLLAAHCAGADRTPRNVRDDDRALRRFQHRLVEAGVPVAWTVDVPHDHPLFATTQLLVVAGAIPRDSPRFHRLEIEPDAPLTEAELRATVSAGLSLAGRTATFPAAADGDATASRERVRETLAAAGVAVPDLGDPPTWADLCAAFEEPVERALSGE